MGFFKKIKKAIGGALKMSLGLAGGLTGGLMGGKPKMPEAAAAPAVAAQPTDASIADREGSRRLSDAFGADYTSLLGAAADEEGDDDTSTKKRLRASRELLG